jgi:hypothetical protein
MLLGNVLPVWFAYAEIRERIRGAEVYLGYGRLAFVFS